MKTGNGKKIAFAAAGAAVIGIGAFAAVRMTAKDPKEIVIQAFENIYTEDQVNPGEELFGISKFAENAGKISSQSGFSLVLEDCSEEQISQVAAGAGLRAEAKADMENNKYSLDLGVIFQNMDLASMEFYYGDETLRMAVPELSSRVFTLDLSDGLAQRMEESPLIGPQLEANGIDPEAIQEYVQAVRDQVQEKRYTNIYDLEHLMQRYKAGCQAQEDFKAALTVEKADKGTFTMDGAEVPCDGYQVVINKDSMINFLRSSSDFFLQDQELKDQYMKQLQLTVSLMKLMGNNAELPSAQEMMDENYEQLKKNIDEIIDQMEMSLNDVSMLVYVDKKGRLAAVDGGTVIKVRSEESAEETAVNLDFDVQLQGGTYLTQNLTVKVEASGNGNTVTADVVKTGTYDGNQKTSGVLIEMRLPDGTGGTFSYDSSYAADTGDCQVNAEFSADSFGTAELEVSGIVDELVKGESVHLTIDRLYGAFRNDLAGEEYFAALSGDWYCGPLTGAAEAPEGELFDVAAADENDWQKVMLEMYIKGAGLLGRLGGFGLPGQMGSVMP